LPRWRGAAPVQRAILAGDAETGVGIMQMERGLDTGPMLSRIACAIGAQTGGELTAMLSQMGAKLLAETLANIDSIVPEIQPEEGVTYAAKIAKTEARLDFTGSAIQAERQVRAFNPAPGAFFEWRGERIRLLAAEATGEGGDPGVVIDERLTIGFADGALRPLLVQRAGRAAMTPQELLRGFAIPAGSRLE
jgi:methionyl-tRNA formyltransferase